MRSQGRQLQIDGLPREAVVAAFAGPAFYDPPGPAALAALRAAKPDMLLLLGDIGDEPLAARETLAALASLPMPMLILAGGRDTQQGMAEAIESLGPASGPVFDITAVTIVRVGDAILIPVAGALDGHYARSSASCGYGRQDLRPRQSALSGARARGRVWLVGWEAPETWGEGAEPSLGQSTGHGDEPAVELARAVGASGGVFAWPPAQPGAGQTPDGALQIRVPRLTGAPAELADGARVGPGFALLGLSGSGLHLLEVRSAE
jgi:hypothetical protein